MCLGIPGQIIRINDVGRRLAEVDVSGVRREICVACVAPPDQDLDALIGEWVLVHVGFAMARVSETEAARTLELLTELGEAESEMRRLRGEA